jgi:hypothetical protein
MKHRVLEQFNSSRRRKPSTRFMHCSLDLSSSAVTHLLFHLLQSYIRCIGFRQGTVNESGPAVGAYNPRCLGI